MPRISKAEFASQNWYYANLETMWHGTHVEAVHSIVSDCGDGLLGGRRASRANGNKDEGQRFFDKEPGVYFHQGKTAHKAENYMKYSPVFGDGAFAGVTFECLCDTKFRVPAKWTDQSAQKPNEGLWDLYSANERGPIDDVTPGAKMGPSIWYVNMWVQLIHYDDLTAGTHNIRLRWNAELEGRPKYMGTIEQTPDICAGSKRLDQKAEGARTCTHRGSGTRYVLDAIARRSLRGSKHSGITVHHPIAS